MYHKREEVIERITREYEQLDKLVVNLTDEQWEKPLIRPETKDPWTVKDALAHITHWKANTARTTRKQPPPSELRGLEVNDVNHLVYMRWKDRTPKEVLAWHRQVQEDVLAALREAPDEWFTGRKRSEQWPFDLDGHSYYHRVKDIERAIAAGKAE